MASDKPLLPSLPLHELRTLHAPMALSSSVEHSLTCS